MSNQITESTYDGYKKLYAHKKDLPYLVGLFMLLDLLIFISIIPIIEITLMLAIIFGICSQTLFFIATSTIMSDYNQKTKLIKQIYPFVDNKLTNHKLKKMLNTYQKEHEKRINGDIECYCEDDKEIINEEDNNSLLTNSNQCKKSIERVNVKVLTLTKRSRK